MKLLPSKRRIAAALAILLVLFLFRPGVHQLSNRISNSISSALGRRVTIDNVRLHLLPRPAFDLENLAIYDDPSFSAEPMIRAQDVSAIIRLRSLVRGRIEISTLSAAEPSINIVRNADGHWNLANLLERSAHIPAAPTDKSSSELRPAFPYLEATHARINFKIGQAKKSWALTDADVALWQESENAWGARLRAQPVRTDLNLTDTGQIQLNATWQRAESLRMTPMQVTIAWQKGQLGQLTQLLTGDDRGWRGSVDLSASLAGTPEQLTIESRGAVEGFRRYDVLDTRNVRLATSCSAKYAVLDNTVSDLLCESPVRDGTVRLRGNLQASAMPAHYDLTLTAQRIPLASMADLWHRVKQQLPADLTASGTVNAVFHAARDDSDFAQLSGTGIASNAQLASGTANNVLVLGDVPFSLISDSRCCKDVPGLGKPSKKDNGQSQEQQPVEGHMRVGPSTLTVNSGPPMNVGGWISATGYHFFLRGDTNVKNMLRLEDVLGIAAARPAADGDARVDVSVEGGWNNLAAPIIVGTAQLRNVHAEIRGLNAPIEIGSAALTIRPDQVRLEKISARILATHLTGEVVSPRHCSVPNAGSDISVSIAAVPKCFFQFDLSADTLSGAELTDALTPHPEKRPWYRLLLPSEPQDKSSLRRIQASGVFNVGHFAYKKLALSQVSTRLGIENGKITLDALHAQLLQGKYQGRWILDASRQPFAFHGNGTLQEISLAQVSALMNDSWAVGLADATLDIDGSANTLQEALSNSDGNLIFVMRNGGFTHVEFPGTPAPLPVRRFSGDYG